MKRADTALVGDIINAAASITDHTRGVTKAQFLRSELHQDAVIRQLGIIGEAASKLSQAFREKHPKVSWHEIVAMRNLTIHQYWVVNHGIVWDTAKDDIPVLVKYLAAI